MFYLTSNSSFKTTVMKKIPFAFFTSYYLRGCKKTATIQTIFHQLLLAHRYGWSKTRCGYYLQWRSRSKSDRCRCTGSLTTGAYCYYNNDSATYAATYGKLYNWYAVNDARGWLCRLACAH